MRLSTLSLLPLALLLQHFAPSTAFTYPIPPTKSIPSRLVPAPLFSTRKNAEEPNLVVKTLEQMSPAEMVFFSGIVLLFATMTPLTSSASGGNVEHGEALFVNNCASCHRGGQNFLKPSKTLQEKDLIKNLGDSDQATIASFFKGSMQHKMLSFPNVPGGKLAETDVNDVAIYVSSQAVQNLWE